MKINQNLYNSAGGGGKVMTKHEKYYEIFILSPLSYLSITGRWSSLTIKNNCLRIICMISVVTIVVFG